MHVTAQGITEAPSWKACKSFYIIFCLLSLLSYSTYGLTDSPLKISESSLSGWIQQGTVTALLKDGSQHLWIGTEDGLYKYDGSTINKFGADMDDQNWIPASYILGIAEDKLGDIYIASYGGGILRFNAYTGRFDELAHAFQRDTSFPVGIVATSTGYVWAYTEHDLFLVKKDGHIENSANITFRIVQDAGKISASATDKNGDLFLATERNLYKILSKEDKSPAQFFELDQLQSDEKITAMTFGDNGELYIGTSHGGVFSIDPSTGSALKSTSIQAFLSGSVTTLSFFENLLWIGTNNGLFRTDKNLVSIQTYKRDNSDLTNNHIVTLLNDERLMWIGTYRGLSTLVSVQFETFNDQNSDVFNDVLTFTEDANGKMWIGTFNGLYFYDEGSKSHINLSEKGVVSRLTDQRIMTLAAKNRNLWIGYRKGGVQILDINSLDVTSPTLEDMQDWEVTKILHSSDGLTWIATFNLGLFSISEEEVTSHLRTRNLNENKITILHESQSGLLAASEQSIFILDKETGKFTRAPLLFEDTTRPPLIFSLSEDMESNIWIGTKDQGIYLWRKSDRESLVFQTTRLGLGNAALPLTIYGMQLDALGNIWCSSQSGIYKIGMNGDVLGQYTMANGLQGNDFNFGATYIDSRKTMYFGGSNGYTRFDPRNIGIDEVEPSLTITKILFPQSRSINFQSSTGIKTLELAYTDHYITFQFAIMDFLNPEKNQYRYRLEGFDDEWIENGTRNTATYTNLPAGDYVLRVQGANSAGIWNREGISLDVHVSPPPWLSWWAYCLYAFAAAIVLWLMRRAYDSYMIERRAAALAVQMNLDAERAEDELQEQLEIQDQLVKSVYQHNVATLDLIADCISTQSGLASEGAARMETGNNVNRVKALVALEECVYHHNDCLLADLKKYTDIIISRLLKDSVQAPENVTTINEVSPQPFPLTQASLLSVALYELLENALQHAFPLERSTNYLHVVFTEESTGPDGATCYRLTVEDDGIGMPDDFDPLSPTSAGLAIVRSMADQLGGTLSIDSRNGTRVSLSFPAGHHG